MQSISRILSVALALMLGACQPTDEQQQNPAQRPNATATPSSASTTQGLVPDDEQAEEIAEYLRAKHMWGYPEKLIARGDAIVPGLVALVKKGDGQVSDALSVPLWQYAGFMLGRIGDTRAVPFMLARIDDEGAMSWRFVDALGCLRVAEAVPYLVHELQTMDEDGWNVMTSAYRTRATYLIHALELITGQNFPKNAHGDPISKEETLGAVTAWWLADGRKRYLTIGIDDPRLSPYRRQLAAVTTSSSPADIEARLGESDDVLRFISSASESVHTLDNGGQLRIMSKPKEGGRSWDTSARFIPKSQPGQPVNVPLMDGLAINLLDRPTGPVNDADSR